MSSKLTRDDEEVTVAFPDPKVGIKRLLASLANLEIIGSVRPARLCTHVGGTTDLPGMRHGQSGRSTVLP